MASWFKLDNSCPKIDEDDELNDLAETTDFERMQTGCDSTLLVCVSYTLQMLL